MGTYWNARYIVNIKEVNTDSNGTTESVLISTNVKPPVDLSGTVRTINGQDICAMVLASGKYTFSCNPVGVFSLTGLPRELDGTVKRQIYADGFFMKVDILADSINEAVVMMRSGACPSYNIPMILPLSPVPLAKVSTSPVRYWCRTHRHRSAPWCWRTVSTCSPVMVLAVIR